MIRTFVSLGAFLLLAGSVTGQTSPWNVSSAGLPVYDHVVIVVEENKYYAQVIGSASAPYINQVLRAEGANLTHMYSEEHESQGNYFWLFCGSNEGVGFKDVIPSKKTHKVYPFRTSNLGQQLMEKKLTFKGYAEDLPKTGSTVSKDGHYARKHVPWISFGNIPQGSNPDSSTNLQFRSFPSDFSKLPTVSIVVPNLVNDMHDPGSHPDVGVKNGDAWLRKNIDPYYQWAKTHNSLLIVTFDESDNPTGYLGLTDPASKYADIQNRIPTIFAGAHVAHGDYEEGNGVTHVNILRTIEGMYGLRTTGTQPPNALKFGITSEYIIKDVFVP
ncbi:MAG TPA: alkaline phosphatase family protein [Bacteroidota bacterium]|nr:alkaline phosphatase family protein [Bacteroidota bacterium]